MGIMGKDRQGGEQKEKEQRKLCSSIKTIKKQVLQWRSAYKINKA